MKIENGKWRMTMRMKYLALDIGRKHTGVAYVDATLGVPVPLPTIHHKDEEELLAAVAIRVSERSIDTLVLGLPLLPSGIEAAQAKYVRHVGKALQARCPKCAVRYLDERRTNRIAGGDQMIDDHAQAALTLLTVALERSCIRPWDNPPE